MKSCKTYGFSLSEVLITLTIVGVVAILVIPGLMKDMTDKSRMAMLHNIVSNANNVVQNEIIQKRAQGLNETDIVKDPLQFLKNFDYSNTDDCFAPEYSGVQDGTYSHHSSIMQAQVLLKNGLCIGIAKENGMDSRILAIDVNGKQDPNKVGIDYFELKIEASTDTSKGIHVGDVGAFSIEELGDNNITEVKKECLTVNEYTARSCYLLVEDSGFDTNYLGN